MDNEIIEFLQGHNLLNHKGMCDAAFWVDQFLKGEISPEQYVAQQTKCHTECKYYMKAGVRIRGDTPNKDHRFTSHCFRNLSNYILNGENQDYSSTFIACIKKDDTNEPITKTPV